MIWLNQSKFSDFCSYLTTSAPLFNPRSLSMTQFKTMIVLSKNFKWNTTLEGNIVRKCPVFWLNQSKFSDFCSYLTTSAPLLNSRSSSMTQFKAMIVLSKNFKWNTTSEGNIIRKCPVFGLNQSKISDFCNYLTTSALLPNVRSSYMARLKAINILSKNFK